MSTQPETCTACKQPKLHCTCWPAFDAADIYSAEERAEHAKQEREWMRSQNRRRRSA